MKNYIEALRYLWPKDFIKYTVKDLWLETKRLLGGIISWDKELVTFLHRLFATLTAPVYLAVCFTITPHFVKKGEDNDSKR